MSESYDITDDVPPPRGCGTWKSAYAQTLTSKKTGEEFEYFARALERRVLDEETPNALIYALEHASRMKKPDDLRDDDKMGAKLPKDSKVCIVGAGMAGMGL